MPTFPLVYTHKLMEIVLCMAKLNKYVICPLHFIKDDQCILVVIDQDALLKLCITNFIFFTCFIIFIIFTCFIIFTSFFIKLNLAHTYRHFMSRKGYNLRLSITPPET